ncbi:ArsR family transcriptional regulator [Archaeoglobales archaeon]|nr:MAG: ArsR family transcriptional regulator [Archaeoglobales archaeon]
MTVEKWINAATLKEAEEYHRRYNYAITNATRRKILRLIDEGKSEEEVMKILSLTRKQLNYHLKVLEWGFCIEKVGKEWVVTKEGRIIDKI